jgi:hypothetical protein
MARTALVNAELKVGVTQLTKQWALPPQRDSLYALSTAIDKKKPIQKWIESGKLSTESTVREVVALSSSKRAKKTEARKQRGVSVTLEFSGNYQRAAELLSQVISDDDVVSVSSDKAFKSALAQELGKSAFTSIADKVK